MEKKVWRISSAISDSKRNVPTIVQPHATPRPQLRRAQPTSAINNSYAILELYLRNLEAPGTERCSPGLRGRKQTQSLDRSNLLTPACPSFSATNSSSPASFLKAPMTISKLFKYSLIGRSSRTSVPSFLAAWIGKMRFVRALYTPSIMLFGNCNSMADGLSRRKSSRRSVVGGFLRMSRKVSRKSNILMNVFRRI